MYEKYRAVQSSLITNEKANRFLSKTYYKIYHILTEEFVYRDLSCSYGEPSGPFKPENEILYKRRHDRIATAHYPSYLSCKSCPVVLPLVGCKGFVRQGIKDGTLQKLFPDCSFEEFIYTPVKPQEVVAAYGLNIPNLYLLNNPRIMPLTEEDYQI